MTGHVNIISTNSNRKPSAAAISCPVNRCSEGFSIGKEDIMTPSESWAFLSLLFGMLGLLMFGDRIAKRICDALLYGGKKSWR